MIFVQSGMYVYCMKSTKYPGIYKIGISNDPKFRSWWISKSMPGNAVVLFKFELYFAYQIEQTLHLIFKPFNVKGLKGSGKTEWFRPGLPWWIWIAAAGAVVYFFPGIIFVPNSVWYIFGIVFVGIALPVVLFLAFVWLFLFTCRVVQETAVAVILFLVFRTGLKMATDPRHVETIKIEKNIGSGLLIRKPIPTFATLFSFGFLGFIRNPGANPGSFIPKEHWQMFTD